MAQTHETVRPTTVKRARNPKAQSAMPRRIQAPKMPKVQAEWPSITYADIVAKAKQINHFIVVTCMVMPDGRVEVVSEAPVEKGVDSPLSAAIARAKTRGASKVSDILKSDVMLTGREFGELIGASHETVNIKRKRGEILGLEGATRGFKYPRWQLTDDCHLLPGLARLFEVLGKQPWTVFRFLLTEHAEIGGCTAVDALKSGQVDAVVGVAENLTVGTFS